MSEPVLRFGSDREAFRTEDEPLVTGRGRFTDDVDVAGQAHAAFVRAQVGHGELRRIDVTAAARMPAMPLPRDAFQAPVARWTLLLPPSGPTPVRDRPRARSRPGTAPLTSKADEDH